MKSAAQQLAEALAGNVVYVNADESYELHFKPGFVPVVMYATRVPVKGEIGMLRGKRYIEVT